VINSKFIDGFFVLFGKIKKFLVLFQIFIGIFVKEIIKDFCYALLDFCPPGIFSKFLRVGFLGDF
jgi:hypothetical protein